MLYNRFLLVIHFKYSSMYMAFSKSLTICKGALKPDLEEWAGEAGTSPIPAGNQKAPEPRCERGWDKRVCFFYGFTCIPHPDPLSPSLFINVV